MFATHFTGIAIAPLRPINSPFGPDSTLQLRMIQRTSSPGYSKPQLFVTLLMHLGIFSVSLHQMAIRMNDAVKQFGVIRELLRRVACYAFTGDM